MYNTERYLATAKHDSSITQIEDVNVCNAELDINVDVALPNVINNVKVIAVDMLSVSDGCVQFGHTVTPTEDEECVKCQKCMCMVSCNTGRNADLINFVYMLHHQNNQWRVTKFLYLQ